MKLLKKFIGYYRPYQKVFYLDMICALVISAVDLAFPQILNYLNATLFVSDRQQILNSLLLLAVGLCAMYAVEHFCKYYVSAQGHIMGSHMERDMRQELFDQYENCLFLIMIKIIPVK